MTTKANGNAMNGYTQHEVEAKKRIDALVVQGDLVLLRSVSLKFLAHKTRGRKRLKLMQTVRGWVDAMLRAREAAG